MNHPKPEEWVPYLYDEAPSRTQRDLAAHLQECPQCREEIESWKRSLSRLDSWKLANVRRVNHALRVPVMRWAAAAVVLLMAGILIGRATSPKPDLEKLRAALAPAIQETLQNEMAELVHQEVGRAASLTLASSHRYSEQVGRQVYVLLKKDVDTVALNADAGLRSTARQLIELADYREPQIQETPNR